MTFIKWFLFWEFSFAFLAFMFAGFNAWLHKLTWVDGFLNVFIGANIIALALLILGGLLTWALNN